jgi:hemerythrin
LQQIGCREAYQHREDHQQFINTLEDLTRNSERMLMPLLPVGSAFCKWWV